MYDDEHPLEVALAWTLAGAVFAIFILAKLGAFEASNLHDINLVNPLPIEFDTAK